MSNLAALIAALAEEGATLRLSDDGEGLRLELRDDAPDLSADLLDRVKASKAELIEHLRAAAPADPIADPPEAAAAAIAPADPGAETAPPIFVLIDGRRQRLEVATIIAPAPSGPELPRAVHPAEIEPYEPNEEEAENWRKAQSRRRAMTVEQATLLEAKLTFGDPIAWRAWRGGY